MKTKMDFEENVRDKMLVDEIVRKTIEEDEKFVFTARLHVMQCMVLLSQFCLSVSPSVCQMRVL